MRWYVLPQCTRDRNEKGILLSNKCTKLKKYRNCLRRHLLPIFCVMLPQAEKWEKGGGASLRGGVLFRRDFSVLTCLCLRLPCPGSSQATIRHCDSPKVGNSGPLSQNERVGMVNTSLPSFAGAIKETATNKKH
ncbi:hypothetical protein PILCRDRAFT_645223 [Piloderma croceum F 1598]|uniref:Uncharacterized protein n=1 Tax=Piloderma croceum (strain F 1598) TaxID=765440 RepID=A0A0C3F990_PILCF|nr:hypothetical protein PILCRDRAFT_645223 [Piloderma croceum F 1598]